MTVLAKEIFASFLSFFVSSNNLIFDLSIKLKSYGGLIDMKSCSLEKYLNDSKLLRLHAFLHDAAGFNHELIRSVQGTVIRCSGTKTTVFWTIRVK